MMGRYRHDAVTPLSFWFVQSFCIAKDDNMNDRTGYSHIGTYCLTPTEDRPDNCQASKLPADCSVAAGR